MADVVDIGPADDQADDPADDQADDQVDVWGKDSFPASDPPANW